MKKVLFTHSYFYRFDEKQWKSKQFYPPLGTLTAASYIRENNFDVRLFDTNLEENPENIIPAIEDYSPDYLVIYDDGFNYLTKMCLTKMREAAFDLIRIGKNAGCKVFVSSSDSTDHYQEYLEKGADAVLLGEAELTLLELLRMESKQVKQPDIQGIAYQDKAGKILTTERRPGLEKLDSLPMAAWDLADIEKYKNIWLKNHGYFSLNLATTRGCPYGCNWCAKPIYGRKYNVRSPENVVEEITFLIKNYGVSHFWICDDIFGLQPGWVQEFRDLVMKDNLKFKYMMQSRVDVMLKDDAIKAMAESGLDTVWVGAESGSQKVLDAMEKEIRVEQIYQAREKLKKHNVKVGFFLQFGYLGETLEDIRKTEKMLFELMPDDIGISVSYPLPGTKFHEKVKNDLKEKANWTDSDDLALMFKNTYPPRFYRMLHRYLHKKFRRKQGIEKMKAFLVKPYTPGRGWFRTVIATLYFIPAAAVYKYLMTKAASAR